ncbi:M48 family metalloprotease [Embleya sp. NPDC020630]|uniref:M48 family metalloprotease n=1 Tax=Embleya sp. NPDC020630 TaxID=3363979 RepID=UPI0037889B98
MIVLPHLAPLDRVRPVGAAAIWALALAARAAVAIGLVLTAVICLPDTPRFAHWVRELPHQVVTGVGDTELALGGLAFLTLAAIARRLRACLRGARTPLRPLPLTGPGGSIVVGDREVLMAAVGRRRRSIVVSAGALAALDDDELAAGLAHEQGHISRAHHWWQAGAEVCRLLGCPAPRGPPTYGRSSTTTTRSSWRARCARRHSPGRSANPTRAAGRTT